MNQDNQHKPETDETDTITPARSSRLPITMLAAFVAAGAVYFISLGSGNDGSENGCSIARNTQSAISAFAKGDVAGVVTSKSPISLSGLAFKDAQGGEMKLGNFSGKTLLLNLWATWCAPCREEMPALNALEEKVGGEDFAVVPVSIDTQGVEKPKKFLADIGAKSLPLYIDETTGVFQELKKQSMAFGMPTTLLVDRNGCSLGVLNGPADWAGDDALALVKAAIEADKGNAE